MIKDPPKNSDTFRHADYPKLMFYQAYVCIGSSLIYIAAIYLFYKLAINLPTFAVYLTSIMTPALFITIVCLCVALYILRSYIGFFVMLFMFGIFWPSVRCMDLPIRILLGNIKYPEFPPTACWGHDISNYFDVQYVQVLTKEEHDVMETEGLPKLLRPQDYGAKRSLLFYTHRCWADFFLTRYLSQSHGACLSRNIIKWVFIPFWIVTNTDYSLWFFDNNPLPRHKMTPEEYAVASTRAREKLYDWMDNNFTITYLESLIVFPEGKRNLGNTPLPLRRGIVYYAYTRNFPVQIIVTKDSLHLNPHQSGNEKIISETKFHYSRNSETVYFKDFDTREAFFDEVDKHFTKEFEFVYNDEFKDDRYEVPLPRCSLPCCDSVPAFKYKGEPTPVTKILDALKEKEKKKCE